MVHRLDSPWSRADTKVVPVAAPTATDASIGAVLALSAALIFVSFALTLLSAFGLGELVPEGLRAVIVVVTAFTVPGLPIAALLRLPLNGVFASVAISISIATTVLSSQLAVVAGLRHPVVQQLLILGLASVATAFLAKSFYSQPDSANRRGSRSWLGKTGFALQRSSRISISLLATSVILFFVAVAKLNGDNAGAYGLIEILSISYFAGLGILCVVLASEYRRRVMNRVMLALSHMLLIMYMAMPLAWAYHTPPFPTAFVHRHIVNWIFNIGELPPAVDARISWGGFFSAAAHLMSVGSLGDSVIFLTSASFFFDVLLIFPIYAIALALTGNARTAWFSATIFIMFNWYQQDYFAPQAIAMQLYLTIFAVLLWQLRSAELPIIGVMGGWRRVPGRPRGRDARWLLGLEAVLLLLIAAMVVSHQLTPLVTIASLFLMSVLGVTRHKLLWLAALLLFCAWFTFGASGYWLGHLDEVFSEIGNISSSLDSGVSDRIAGDPVYGRMQLLRIGAAVFLFAIAALGWFRLRRTKYGLPTAALAFAPFTIIAVQSYGGEVVIRCFLYASPFLASLAAIALRPLFSLGTTTQLGRWLGTVLMSSLLLIFAAWGLTNRGLNTSFEYTPPDVVVISDQLVRQVDSVIIAYWGQGTLIGLPRAYDIGPDCIRAKRELAECTASRDVSYLIVTSQDEKFLHYRFNVNHDAVDQALGRLISYQGFEMLYQSEHVKVLKRTNAPHVRLGSGQ